MLKESKEKAEVMSLRQVYCENSGVYVVFGNVFLQWVQNRGRDQVLEVLYAAKGTTDDSLHPGAVQRF